MNDNSPSVGRTLDEIRGDIPKRIAISKLIGYCEGIAKSGILGDQVTEQLLDRVSETAVAFGMPIKVRADA